MNIYEKLMNIQTELNCPKDLYNKFGKYAYRNTESILEALKPLLLKYKVIINITDKIELVGDRHYVKATAKVMDIEKGEEIMSTAYAREASEQSGMQASQLSGSTSSYARKYALNGLFAIDDTKDADTTNTHGKDPADTPNKPTQQNKPKPNTNTPVTSNKATVGELQCSDCSVDITEAVKTFSTKNYGKSLCFDCQKNNTKI